VEPYCVALQVYVIDSPGATGHCVIEGTPSI
jgi:hypothetical protein